jgi:outer membrane receptor protein involved in Fe transport
MSEKPDLSFREADKIASVTINYQQNRLNGNLIAIYHGERETPIGGDINNRITLPDYWLLMGKINYQLAPGWQAFIQAKNMLDENYKTPATVTVLSEGVPNRGREILAGVGWEF